MIYFTAFDLFDLFARYTFSSSEEAKDAHANIFDCDLLIIDDLGTELTNSFVSSALSLHQRTHPAEEIDDHLHESAP